MRKVLFRLAFLAVLILMALSPYFVARFIKTGQATTINAWAIKIEPIIVPLACIAVYMLLAWGPKFARFMEVREATDEKPPLVQFSLRRLMAAMALIAIGITLGLGVVRNPLNIVAWVASGAAIGAGLLLPLRRPIVGALCGAFIQFCCGLSILLSHLD